jgi:hypothetical protein
LILSEKLLDLTSIKTPSSDCLLNGVFFETAFDQFETSDSRFQNNKNRSRQRKRQGKKYQEKKIAYIRQTTERPLRIFAERSGRRD